MYFYIYSRPLWLILWAICISVVLWGALGAAVRGRLWQLANGGLAALSLLAIVYATLMTRSGMAAEPVLTPFVTFLRAREQPEYYRTMVMNVFLFLPLGLSLSQVLPARWPVWVRVLVAGLAGLLVSAAVEWLQFRYGLGQAETDDVLCNGLGAFLGGTSLLCRRRIRRIWSEA